MLIRIVCALALLTTACGATASKRCQTCAQPEPQAIYYSVPGETSVQTAPIETPKIQYRSVQKPVTQLIAEGPETLHLPSVPARDVVLPSDSETDTTTCPGLVQVPSYAAQSIAQDNEDYSDELTSSLPKSSMTYDRFNHNDDYDASDYETEFSRPSKEIEEKTSKTIDPSPIRSGSKRLPRLR